MLFRVIKAIKAHLVDVSCTRTISLLWIGYFLSYFPLIICNAILQLIYNLIHIKDILTKFHTCVKQIKTTSHAQEP